MLDFVIFAFTTVIGLLFILLYFVWGNRYTETSGSVSTVVQNTSTVASGPTQEKEEDLVRLSDVPSTQESIPRWTTPPADKELGDLGEMAEHGSLHQYLLHLHDNGKIPMTSFWWGKIHVISVCSPQAFKETVKLVNKPVELFMDFEPLFGSTGIDFTNDEEWERRQKCLYHTLKGEELKEYFPVFVKIAQETVAYWSSFSINQSVPLMKNVYPLTMKGFTRTCLGDMFENQALIDKLTNAYNKCWREMEERITMNIPPDSEREAEFQNNKQITVDIIQSVIQSRKEGAEQREIPFIDSMLQHYDSEEKIISDTISFMVGGLNITGSLLTWMLWYLAENPTSQDHLRDEIDSEVKGECGDRLKEYAGRNDTFMRQVMDETIRVTTLTPYTARYSDNDIVVCGHTIKAGTPIIHALGVGLKNQTTWKDIDKWDPDRFSADGKRGLEFCPFGVPSRRKCPGYLFSYFEVGVFAAILLGRFKVEPVEGQKVIQFHGLVTEPKEEIFVYIKERQ